MTVTVSPTLNGQNQKALNEFDVDELKQLRYISALIQEYCDTRLHSYSLHQQGVPSAAKVYEEYCVRLHAQIAELTSAL